MIITKLLEDNLKLQTLSKLQFAKDINIGLSSTPKKLSSKYFYDTRGSQIFQEITKLDEYYLTRAELEILERIKNILPDLVGKNEVDIVELGVGDGHKTKIIINSFLDKKIKVNFFPIDISAEAMHLLEDHISESKNLNIHAVVGEYIEGMNFAREHSKNRQIVLFLGSNIGNFNKTDGENILKKIKSILKKDDFLLIGFDLKKDIEFMTRAYSDHEGITAKFNLNILERINTELRGNFEVENFEHLALYNPELGAMESYLISLKDQIVTISELKKKFKFDAYEPIHLEYSFKFLEKDIQDLSIQGGFKCIGNFKDGNKYFIDSLWQV
ncbi:MAG: L-histidine N(alpha)-methyltransferase [Bacteriovorax sp.]|nr:L-histidine N(alpha)-methyltransferase [Bacteriovorax sp.]